MGDFPPKDAPEEYDRQTLIHEKLEAGSRRAVDRLSAGRDGTDQELIGFAETIVSEASRFFDYSVFAAEDFGVQSGDLYGGVVVFGGTNRLQWSVVYGFRYIASHCSSEFIERSRQILDGYRPVF